jgi:hypothetical protein
MAIFLLIIHLKMDAIQRNGTMNRNEALAYSEKFDAIH